MKLESNQFAFLPMLQKAAGFPPMSQQLSLTSADGWNRLAPGPTHAGTSVTTSTAMQITAAFCCVRILCETIGAMPWQVYERKDDDTVVRVRDHDLEQVLCWSPNEEMTVPEYKEAAVNSLCLRGNSYNWKEVRANGQLLSLTPISTDVLVERDKDTQRLQYKVLDRGKYITVPKEKIWHVRGFGSDGIVGYSPIGMARQALGVALAAEEFQAKFFGNGAMPSLALSVPAWMNDTQRKAAHDNINRLWGGLSNAHRVQLLEGGMTVTPITMDLKDAEFLALRQFTIQEICRIYRIPPHMVADLTRSTNNNIEHQALEFVMHSLLPYLTRFEYSASKHLIKPEERRKYFLRFNVEGLLRADVKSRGEFYSIMLQNGVYSRNEVRLLENRNRVEQAGMDDYTCQVNLAPTDMLREIAAKGGSSTGGLGGRNDGNTQSQPKKSYYRFDVDSEVADASKAIGEILRKAATVTA
jgi:HK97 family phage portal protein